MFFQFCFFFFFQAEDGIRDRDVTGIQTCALPISPTAPTRVPIDLLLRVARSAGGREGGCTIEGTVDPGAEVRVEGRAVEPAADGRFAVRLPARKGGARGASVVTRDASGRVLERRVACAREVPEHDVSDFA